MPAAARAAARFASRRCFAVMPSVAVRRTCSKHLCALLRPETACRRPALQQLQLVLRTPL